MAAPARVSKNAREGKREARKRTCSEGHELRAVAYVALRGSRRIRLVCACVGYEPINVQAPYRGLKAKIKTGGNARIWFEQPGGNEA